MWDEFFMKGLQTGADIALKKAELRKKNNLDLKDAMMLSMMKSQGLLDEGVLSAAGYDISTLPVTAPTPDAQGQIAGMTAPNPNMQAPLQRGFNGLGGVPPTQYMNPRMAMMKDFLVQTPESKIQQDLYSKAQESNIQTQKEISSQEGKASAIGGRDYARVSSTTDTNLGQFFKFADEQYKRFGKKPGDYLGMLDRLTPDQLNTYKQAFESSSKEASATVARALIPNMRAIQGAIMFRGSTASIGSTLSAGINNVAETMGNTFGSAISNNIDTVDNDGNKVKIQDITIDPKSGKPLSQLPIQEKTRAINDLKNKFFDEYKLQAYASAYKTNRNLLNEKDMEAFRNLVPDKQKFKTEAEALKAKLPTGAIAFIGGLPYIKD